MVGLSGAPKVDLQAISPSRKHKSQTMKKRRQTMKTRSMTLISALDDLVGTTLAAVSGILGKLEYISGLREAGGARYSHWGLTRIYGEEAAQRALAEAHRLVFLKVLHTPIGELQSDLMVSSQASQMRPEEFVEGLRSHLPVLVPADLGGGSARHLSSMLHALSSLASNRLRIPTDATPLI